MTYPAAYFDKWYRSSRRVHAPADRARTVRMVLGVAEYMLGRAARTVLDVGAGEGPWYPVLRRLRPSIRYAGVDPSAYAVARYGRSRHIRLGALGNVPRELARRRYDIIVCSGMLNYVSQGELRAGLAQLADLARGIAFLELFTRRDDVHGDTRGRRPASVYRSLLHDLGFRHCGPHCYIGPQFEGALAEMEVG